MTTDTPTPTLATEVAEFLSRLSAIEGELTILKDDRKSLMDEFSSRLDVKALKAALRIHKIRIQNYDNNHTIDQLLEVINGQ